MKVIFATITCHYPVKLQSYLISVKDSTASHSGHTASHFANRPVLDPSPNPVPLRSLNRHTSTSTHRIPPYINRSKRISPQHLLFEQHKFTLPRICACTASTNTSFLRPIFSEWLLHPEIPHSSTYLQTREDENRERLSLPRLPKDLLVSGI